MNERQQEGGRLVVRWAMLLTCLALFAGWATCRMNQARVALESGAGKSTGASTSAEASIEYWTCTMHPDVRQPAAGDCPICGMTLVAKYAGSDQPGVKPVASAAAGGSTAGAKQQRYMCTMPECNDTPSTDPNSRCPVCGMKREPIGGMDTAGGSDVELTLGERARRLAEVSTEAISERRLFKHIRTVGKVGYDETRHKMVTAWIGGRIDRLFADYTGMVVSKGDHLVELYSPDLVTAQEEYLTALRGVASLSGASQSTRDRSERLVESAARQLELLGVTQEQIDRIRRDGKASTRLTIHAPIGGTIVRKPAMEGMYVKTGEALYEIADLESVWILLDLYESDLPWIAPLQRVRVTSSALPGEELIGHVAFVDPVIDRMTRTVSVRVNAMNRGGLLKPQMFVNAELFVSLADSGSPAIPRAAGAFVCPMHPWDSGDSADDSSICGMKRVPVSKLPGYREPKSASDVLAVPREAVLQTGERSLVYVESRPGTYAAVEIEVGPLAEDDEGHEYFPILSGLRAGEHVVVRGNFAIDSQMQISGKQSLFNRSRSAPAGGGHNHHAADAPTPTSETASVADGEAGQPLCPVMGNEIDPEVFAEVHGVRVYFCCPPCIKRFVDDPAKYLPELPAPLASKIRAAMKRGGDHD